MMPSAEASLAIIAENTTPKRRMLQRFGSVFIDPSEIICVDTSAGPYHVYISTGQRFEFEREAGEELLSYLSLDSVG